MIWLHSFRSARLATGVLLIGALLSPGEQRIGLGQTIARGSLKSAQTVPNEAVMRERIAAIIHGTIKQGEATINGVKIWTRVPPPNEDVEELKGYGDKAVPFLERYIWAENRPEASLALALLGNLGGTGILKPLEKVIRTHHAPSMRMSALRSLRGAPWDRTMSIIQWAANTDPDPEVRMVAKDILQVHRSK